MYLNDGLGGFTKAPPDSLPDETDSGSSVCAFDFDRDGDLDLIVGGRVTSRAVSDESGQPPAPQQWPWAVHGSDGRARSGP